MEEEDCQHQKELETKTLENIKTSINKEKPNWDKKCRVYGTEGQTQEKREGPLPTKNRFSKCIEGCLFSRWKIKNSKK